MEAAYSLYANGVGDRLWVIGAGKKTTVMGLAKVQASEVAQNIPWDRVDRIQVETESRNTIENAFAVKRYLEQFPQVKNVILVTSPYHMRRSMMMISQHISQEIKIIPFTPTNADFGLKNWWHSWTGISVTVSELVKFRLANIVIPRLKYF